ncbi:P-loop containing nucleoside triphosphate hydrolase protein [Gymnopilus junonius]|uniref:P-loop containing nucleoside triphosphate hydrolase protein n=1 Tax=Gymnopilus junonius TaxID=109634 RepID=A0A9P5N9A5_GYMJU|nr:P-loop containing nucleoside triphosphate hydrolase protein [Gymnopilus junonius]
MHNAQGATIGFQDASFAWSLGDESEFPLTPLASSNNDFTLKIEGELKFKTGGINLIIGPTGSGKTSMLMALLGEMHLLPSSNPNTWFNLPRSKGVAYAAQESWVQNATIRDNILFGSPYEQERYETVLYQCALEPDLELFQAHDLTEVGERGLTLSGGQKARVTLARAVYSTAEIILLDDVLAALDVHTSDWIVNKCFRGNLVRGRTILLVTHNIALLAPLADFIVTINSNGTIQARGSEIEKVLEQDSALALEVENERQKLGNAKETADDQTRKPEKSGKLVVTEEIAQGRVTWQSINLLISALGGDHLVLFFTTWVLIIVAGQWVDTFQVWFLGAWGSQYEVHPPSEVNLYFYLSIFFIIAIGNIVISSLSGFLFNSGVLRSTRVIHSQLIRSVFSSTFRWLDETPTARIIARCTQDINAVDGPIPQAVNEFTNETIITLTKLGAVVLFTPASLIPGVGVAVAGSFMGRLYLKSQLSARREMSNSRSPLIAHFIAAMHGLVSIRAYGAQNAFKEESLRRIDYYSRAARTSWDLNRWIALRMDVLGTLFTASLAAYLVYGTSVSAANTGFSLTMALRFCGHLFLMIRIFNDLEVQSNSLERIQQYIDIEHEPKSTAAGMPPAAWPTNGSLRVENLSARYSQFGPTVLQNITFQVNPGERIGVVGRTGSGKSSLTLALLRCLITEGAVYYDGIDINSINLDALRSSISIIPQAPELLNGTLRQNLDPFEQHDDEVLYSALRDVGLFSLQEGSITQGRFNLSTQIAGGGSNVSVGERQILALARAMIRGSKLLILDEATSAIGLHSVLCRSALYLLY